MNQRRQQHKWGSQSARTRHKDGDRCRSIQTHIKRELEISREGKTKKKEQRYDGTKQGTYEIGGRKRRTDVGRRGERKIQSGSGRKTYTIRRKKTCMDGSTCWHESDASYHIWQ